jgi:hypothetical protein
MTSAKTKAAKSARLNPNRMGNRVVIRASVYQNSLLFFVFFNLQLIPGDGPGCGNCAGWQLDNGISAEAERNAALNHIRTCFQYFFRFVQEDHVDRELHSERVDSFAGRDPQAFAWLQAGVFQQACAAGFAGIGDSGAVREQASAGLICDSQSSQAASVA